MSGGLLVLSGPSGCGKSSLVNEIIKEEKEVYFSISTTTREIRDGEKEGVNYFYVSKEEFEKGIEEGEFLEWAEVHGNYYGTSLKPVKKALSEGKLVIFDIDVQGHEIVKQKFPLLITSIFITTPTLKELEKRLKNRATDSEEVIKNRIENAKDEIKRVDEYEFFLINDDFSKALEELKSIIKVAKIKKPLDEVKNFIKNW
jgi:guanylate kinase